MHQIKDELMRRRTGLSWVCSLGNLWGTAASTVVPPTGLTMVIENKKPNVCVSRLPQSPASSKGRKRKNRKSSLEGEEKVKN